MLSNHATVVLAWAPASYSSRRRIERADPLEPLQPVEPGLSVATAALQSLTGLQAGHDASSSSSLRAAVGEAAVDADDTVAGSCRRRRASLTAIHPGNRG
jgi:hypothetical protein